MAGDEDDAETRVCPVKDGEADVNVDVALTESSAALAVVRDRVGALVASIPDMTVPIRGSEWRVREAAVHMFTESDVHTGMALGKPTPRSGVSKDEIARDNERFLAEVPEATPDELGEWIRGAVDRFLDGGRLGAGAKIDGPAIIEEVTTTLVIEPGWSAKLDESGSYLIRPRKRLNGAR